MPHRSPRVYVHSHCYQMITQQWPKGSPRVVGGHSESAIFQPTHAALKTNKSSPVGPHRGSSLGNLEIAPGTHIIG